MYPDVVVLLPGILGSVLANGAGKEVWSPTAGTVWRAITSRGGSITGLEVDSDGNAGDVKATRLMPDATIIPGFVKIDGYTQVEEYLIGALELRRGQNYFPFPYDWRLDNRIHAERLAEESETWLRNWRQSSGNTKARLVLIGHSMGGLVARYFLECLHGWKQTRLLITLGTPYFGSLNAVDSLVHGMKKGVGPFGLDLGPVLRSLPSIHQLLPTYRCIDVDGPKLLHVDKAADDGKLPNVVADRVRAARRFHEEIKEEQAKNARDDNYDYRIVPLVGLEQPTNQSAYSKDGVVKMLTRLKEADDGGDGTVPRISATPLELVNLNREVFAAEMHGSLQNGAGPQANLRGILLQPTFDVNVLRATLPTPLRLVVDDVVLPGEPLTVRVKPASGNPRIAVQLTNLDTRKTIDEILGRSREPGWQEGEYDVGPGNWRVTIEAAGAESVTDLVVVAEP